MNPKGLCKRITTRETEQVVWMLLLLILASVVGLALCYWYFKPIRKGLPPLVGPGMLDTVAKFGTLVDLTQLHFFSDLSADVRASGKGTSNGAVFRLRVPQLHEFIVSSDYKLIRKVLEGSSKDKLLEGEKLSMMHTFDYASIPSILTESTASAARHQRRKHLAVSFSIKNLEYTQKVMKDCLQKFGSILEDHGKNKESFMLDNAMISLTLDIISESAFGVNFNSMVPGEGKLAKFYTEENERFLKEASVSTMNPLRKFMFWAKDRNRALVAKANLMKMAQNLMDTYRVKNSENTSDEDDTSIMGKLMSCEYANDEGRAQDILIMLLGGHETSSHTLSYLILGLIRNPDAKKLLQAELDACISAKTRDDISQLSCSEVMNLPYLSQCIKESMRLWSVVGGGIWRELTTDIHYEDYVLPAGSTFVAASYAAARQPWIDRPDDFLPERWSDENPQHSALKEVSMPFGAGRRQCIGQNLAKMEVAMIAAYTLRFFDFELVADPVEQIFLTVKPVDMSVKVQLRE